MGGNGTRQDQLAAEGTVCVVESAGVRLDALTATALPSAASRAADFREVARQARAHMVERRRRAQGGSAQLCRPVGLPRLSQSVMPAAPDAEEVTRAVSRFLACRSARG